MAVDGPCGPVVVDGPWMQTHSGFDPPAAKTNSHCSAHHGCGYVRMKTRERICRGCTSHPGVRSEYLIDPDLIFFCQKKIREVSKTVMYICKGGIHISTYQTMIGVYYRD